MPTVLAVHASATTHLIVSRAVAAVPRAELAGSTSSAVEAARVIDTLAPDAVTIDAHLPDGDGIELAERLRANHPGLAVVLFGPAPGRQLLRALGAGVCAYVPEPAEIGATIAAIRNSLTGRGSFSSRSLTNALRYDRSGGLSSRENQVARLLREGFGPAQIAKQLSISESSVKTYVSRIRAKGDRTVR
jgi:DNA-binding NarL/FixJ family response regulator